MPGLQVMEGALLSFTYMVIEQVLFSEPLVAFHVIVVVPLFNCTPLREVPVADVAPLKLYDKATVPQLLAAVGLNSLLKIVYLHDVPAYLVNGLPDGELIDTVPFTTVIDLVAYFVPQLFDTVYLMVAVPVEIPLINPEVASTVATAGWRLIQLPPAVPLLVKVVVAPTQMLGVQLNEPAFGCTFTVTVKLQLVVLPQ